MFDIGGWELLVIAALALIVVGPKDLPRLIRNVGKWVGKARSLARDFQSGMEQAAREADLQDEVKMLGDAKRGFRDTVSSYDADIRSSSAATPGTPKPPSAPRTAGTAKPGSAKATAPASAAARSTPPKPAVTPKPAAASAPPQAPAPSAAASADDAVLDGFSRGVRGE